MAEKLRQLWNDALMHALQIRNDVVCRSKRIVLRIASDPGAHIADGTFEARAPPGCKQALLDALPPPQAERMDLIRRHVRRGLALHRYAIHRSTVRQGA